MSLIHHTDSDTPPPLRKYIIQLDYGLRGRLYTGMWRTGN